ncbi:hypothetical protein sscle_14g100180 [Sclerotinia sclerotiorum 1980 UF-70]|uniref:NADH dehydrogenase [ubiquinone] 1 alpha subcomplex assembly factor 3 n=2 Tax=Sclerotinia sclerotiorum (strain ATCC 18683 / 1980 / Ss-1) TaxID=665079 RepID=A0A1D9QJZ2_SCLS1|nr:hypothetical protein sscle_14g100180 [Sclerotinia sclerotiorum 1980 UF-70]
MSHLRHTSLLRARPSIHEIANSILSPRSSFSTHCINTSLRYTSQKGKSLNSRPTYQAHPSTQSPQINISHSRRYSEKLPSSHKTPISISKLPTQQSPQHTSHTYSHPPTTHDRGPLSSETTQTDFSMLDVLGNTPSPSTSIDACLSDGFHLNSGVKIGGDGKFVEGKWRGGSGVLLVGGEAFGWRPWVYGEEEREKERELVNKKGQFDCADEVWGVLGCVWPRPDLLILGLGKEMRPISPKTRAFINGLGIRIEVADTRNAAAQFNLLATERGVGSVAAALLPIGR